ncbi:MAG: hypothetical protein C0483_10420 [Pirellula sp.]|nr:hypothetical protein [Pirellula sp.]
MVTPYLPVRELPLSGESLTGYVRRHVEAIGYDGLGRLLSLVDNVRFPPHLDQLRQSKALDELGHLLRRSSDTLRNLTVHAWSDRLMLRRRQAPSPPECDSKTILRYFDAAQPRVCRQCLTGSPMHERLIWSFRPLPICIEHAAVLFARCPSCRRNFASRRLDLVHCRCGYALTNAPSISVSDELLKAANSVRTALDDDEETEHDWPPYACFWWIDRLRSAVARTRTCLQRTRTDWQVPAEIGDNSLAWLIAAALVGAPDRLATFWDEYQTVDKHCSTSTGVGRSFGLLLRDADYLERLGFPGPAEMLRPYLLQRYMRGHLTSKVILFRSSHHRRLLDARPWLSQTAAARRLRVTPTTIADLVRRQTLTGKIHPAGHRGRTVGLVSKASLEVFRSRMATSVSTRAAGNQLGIERHRVAELIEAGVLPEAWRTACGWRLSQATVDELLRAIRQQAPHRDNCEPGIQLHEATRRFGAGGLNLVRIVAEILAGRLIAHRSVEHPTLREVYVDLADLRRIAQTLRTEADTAAGYPLNRLAAVLIPGQPLKDVVLRKWIRAGLLAATRRRKAWHVETEEVARFRTTYCLALEACSLLNISRSTLGRWEREQKITPVYCRRTHSGAGASVFCRADVEQCRSRNSA